MPKLNLKFFFIKFLLISNLSFRIVGKLIFQDNFDTLDANVWLHESLNEAHLDEFQLYTDTKENSYSEHGILHIKPTLVVNEESDKFHPIRSARLSTKNSFSFTYGIIEFRARIPSGDWLFPALWLMPTNSQYGPWPTSGEIDVMESRGNRNLTDTQGNFVGVQQVSSTLHWGPRTDLDGWKLSHFSNNDNSCFSNAFHTYKTIWTPESISFHVDEEQIGITVPPEGGYWEMGDFNKDDLPNPWSNGTKSAPFDQSFYLIINLAVGGTHFFSDADNNEGGKPWKNTSPNAGLDFWKGRDQWLGTWNLATDDSHFLIDYVRVWDLE
ncbi:unnamed protein product [Ceutorhynchus assimilis]|uniref:GH16 domain-containing protein n=1 Tax=Ceutorhynchus assimilis TaxID=467358 RepID=A0A9N9QPI5_9CUCU|nr:unnamed protein product [Ceutorhynchus assimilis]